MKAMHYFAAANTGGGFYNCFDNINDPRREGFLYILKGGPGTGKSTLMKKIGGCFEAAGEAVEYFHCSSDADSLDGVRLVRINAAVIDGTAPHAADPGLPKITGEIINLGGFIGPGVREHKDKILKLSLRKKECFDAAYGYIKAAAAVDAAGQRLLAAATRPEAVKSVLKELRRDFGQTGRAESGGGSARRLFLSAAGGEGRISCLDKNRYDKITRLTGNAYAAQAILLGLACDIAFCDPLSPEGREAVQIAQGGSVALIGGMQPIGAQSASLSVKTVCLLDTLAKGKYRLCRDGLLYGRETAEKLLGFAAKALSEAKAAHGGIEAYYVSAMDFGALDRAADGLITELSERVK